MCMHNKQVVSSDEGASNSPETMHVYYKKNLVIHCPPGHYYNQLLPVLAYKDSQYEDDLSRSSFPPTLLLV